MLTKEKRHKTIDRLPNNLNVDQVNEELILLEKIEEAINDANEGRTFTTEEVKSKLEKWFK
jgi:predicted transcriptional regulator